MKHPDYPGVSSMTDRHGKIRWRFRRSGHRDVMMPGEPGSQVFEQAYQAAIEGRKAEIIQHPAKASPFSLRAAYRVLRDSAEWRKLDAKSQTRYQQTIERILRLETANGSIADGPMADIKRSTIKAILAHFEPTPHMERIALLCLRKLILVALDEEWIDTDPAYKIVRSPQTDGHKAWPLHILAKYEARWAIGTRQRTAYALALWMGNRASDVCRLKWTDLTTKHIMDGDELRAIEGFEFVQFKGRKRGKTIFVPMTPMLSTELEPLERGKGTVLKNSSGGSYKDGSISGRMRKWCEDAGIPAGYTMHGLRKALGVKLAEADASTRQIMEALGHSNIALAELYSREASKTKLAMQAMDKVAKAENARPKPALRAVK